MGGRKLNLPPLLAARMSASLEAAADLTHELVFRNFLARLRESTDPEDERLALGMCEYPGVRIVAPGLGCHHVTHPAAGWQRVLAYLVLGVTPALRRCPCCRGVLHLPGEVSPSLEAHASCPLWPAPPARPGKGCCFSFLAPAHRVCTVAATGSR